MSSSATVVETDPVLAAGGRRHLPAVAALVAVGANVLWLLPMHDDLGDTHVTLSLLNAVAFSVAGAVAMHMRPGNPTGPAMLALAVLINVEDGFFETLVPWRFTVGLAGALTSVTLLAWLALAFPTGRLRGRWGWLLCLALAGLNALFIVVRLLWLPPAALCFSCPPAGNLLFVGSAPFEILDALDRLGIAYAVLVALVMITLLARWLRASRPARRVLGPVVLTTVLLTAKVTLDHLVLAPELWGESFTDVRLAMIHPNQLLSALIPLMFLLAVVRSEFGRSPLAGLLADVVDDRAPARVDHALAAALGDASLRVGYRAEGAETFVDLDGRPLELPGPGSAGRARFVGEPDDPFAVIVHDAALGDDHRQLEAATAAAGMALRREQLRAELRVRLQQLSDSRERMLHSVENQRLRMESELERGVDDRLVELTSILHRVRSQAVPASALDALEDVSAEVHRARADLHAFVRGVRPAALAADGLVPALHDLARSAPIPIDVGRAPGGLSPAVEGAIWFVCSESIVNLIKHARASRAEVDVHVDADTVHVRVTDDGRGGATDAAGSGLRGLRERIETLGGSLSVVSAAGEGTSVHAAIPLSGATATGP